MCNRQEADWGEGNTPQAWMAFETVCGTGLNF